MAKKHSAPTPAVALLQQTGIPHTLQLFDAGTEDFGHHAVAALGVPASQVFKTLVVQVERKGEPPALGVACVPVSGQLDVKAAARAFGARRVAMAQPAAAEHATGYHTGGISPLGQKRALPTVIDTSALDHEAVCVSAGRRGLEVTLAPGDLIALANATVAAICTA